MFKFIHHLLDPHCIHCKEEKEESRICQSCEILKQQLESANYEKKELMNLFIEKQKIPESNFTEGLKPIRPKTVPWNVRRQELEAEDRVRARLIKDAPIPISVEDLEKEIGIVENERD